MSPQTQTASASLLTLFTRLRSPLPARASGPVRRPAPQPDNGRFFLHVRSVEANGAHHLFQFALVDDLGNVTVSVFASRASPVIGAADPQDVAPRSPAVLWEQLHEALSPCHGASLVVFGQALQGSLLPYGTSQAVAGVTCARARFLKAARRRGIRVGPGEVTDLNDARRIVGLPILRSPDAAVRGLGLRELWRWMDGA